MHHKINLYRPVLIIVIGIALFSVACQKSQKNRAIETENLLAASGFTMRLADTPEKIALFFCDF